MHLCHWVFLYVPGTAPCGLQSKVFLLPSCLLFCISFTTLFTSLRAQTLSTPVSEVEIHLLSVYGLSSWGFDSDFTAFCVTTAQYRIWSIKMSLFGLILQMWCFFASWWHSLCAIWVQQQNFLIIVNYHGFCSLDCHINSTSGCLEVCMYTLPEISAEI